MTHKETHGQRCICHSCDPFYRKGYRDGLAGKDRAGGNAAHQFDAYRAGNRDAKAPRGARR